MLDVATLNVKQQLNRIIASCAFNKFNSNHCSIQLRNTSDHVVLVFLIPYIGDLTLPHLPAGNS